MRRGRRSRWRAGVGLIALLALAGCGAVPPGIDEPSRTQAPTAEADQSASTPPSSGTDDAAEESSSSTPSQPRADIGYRLPRLGPGDAPGMVARLAAMAAPDFAVVVRWATPAGATAFGDALDARFADLARGAAAARGFAWSPGVDIAPGGVGSACAPHPLTPPTGVSLTVDCQIVVAAGSVVGNGSSCCVATGRRPLRSNAPSGTRMSRPGRSATARSCIDRAPSSECSRCSPRGCAPAGSRPRRQTRSLRSRPKRFARCSPTRS